MFLQSLLLLFFMNNNYMLQYHPSRVIYAKTILEEFFLTQNMCPSQQQVTLRLAKLLVKFSPQLVSPYATTRQALGRGKALKKATKRLGLARNLQIYCSISSSEGSNQSLRGLLCKSKSCIAVSW